MILSCISELQLLLCPQFKIFLQSCQAFPFWWFFSYLFLPCPLLPGYPWVRPIGLEGKDTKTLIGYLKVPQINPQVISRHVGLVVAVDGYGVDVVCVRIGKHSSWGGLHHQVHGSQDGHLGYERGTVLRTDVSFFGRKWVMLCPYHHTVSHNPEAKSDRSQLPFAPHSGHCRCWHLALGDRGRWHHIFINLKHFPSPLQGDLDPIMGT